MSVGSNEKLWRPKQLPHFGAGTVFTNGCFDILHAGHVRFLRRARLFGSKLFVAVNSDDSVRKLKGDGRPINKLEDRVDVLAALTCVDAVTWFDEPDVAELIRLVHPHCWIKGGDYTLETLNQREVSNAKAVGVSIVILEKFGDYSTTGILEKLKG